LSKQVVNKNLTPNSHLTVKCRTPGLYSENMLKKMKIFSMNQSVNCLHLIAQQLKHAMGTLYRLRRDFLIIFSGFICWSHKFVML